MGQVNVLKTHGYTPSVFSIQEIYINIKGGKSSKVGNEGTCLAALKSYRGNGGTGV